MAPVHPAPAVTVNKGIRVADPDPADLLSIGHRAGLDVIGFADAKPFEMERTAIEARKRAGLHAGMQFTYRNPARSTDPSRVVPGARSLVVAARSYRRAAPVGDETQGTVARYSWIDHYRPLRAGLEAVAVRLRAQGWRARTVADDNAMVDRAAAARAGLGWFGKNTMVLLPGAGSWFVLGSVVTDAPLPVSAEAPVPDGCGACTRCVTACPTGALDEPGVLDARRCLAWLLEAPGDFPLEYRKALGGRVYGCDACQEACPINRRVDRRQPAPPPAEGEEPQVDLVGMLESSDDELLARFARWYVPGRQARYLRRNALVALGNVGRGSDPGTGRAIRSALENDDPMLRSHARWAASRLGIS
jgi:epoxyqueuosine reductase